MEQDFNKTPVTSGNLSEVGFNPETMQGRVTFNKSGATYEYDNCTQAEADQIISAPSANDAFKAVWGNGRKVYRKL